VRSVYSRKRDPENRGDFGMDFCSKRAVQPLWCSCSCGNTELLAFHSPGCENSEAAAFNDPVAGTLAENLSLAVGSA